MNSEQYGQWLKNNMRDPLWWVAVLSLVLLLLLELLSRAGVAGFSRPAPSLADDVLWLVFFLAFVACAVRGRSIGDRLKMSVKDRLGHAALGIAGIVIVFVTCILPALAG